MQYGASVTWCAKRSSGSTSFSSLPMKYFPPSMRAIFSGHTFGGGAAESTGAAAAIVALEKADGDAVALSPPLFIKKKPAPPITIAPMAIPATSPPFERDEPSVVDDATGSRV